MNIIDVKRFTVGKKKWKKTNRETGVKIVNTRNKSIKIRNPLRYP